MEILKRASYLLKGQDWPPDVIDRMRPAIGMLDTAMDIAAHKIRRIRYWDLDDPDLLLVLGYISGFIDAAYQAIRPKKYDETFIGEVFQDSVIRYLSKIPGVEKYLDIQQTLGGNRTIGGLQSEPRFMVGMLAGGQDFLNIIGEKRAPFSLMKLLN